MKLFVCSSLQNVAIAGLYCDLKPGLGLSGNYHSFFETFFKFFETRHFVSLNHAEHAIITYEWQKSISFFKLWFIIFFMKFVRKNPSAYL